MPSVPWRSLSGRHSFRARASSRCAHAGSPHISASVGWITFLVSILSIPSRAPAETHASPGGLPASDNSAPPTGRLRLVWQEPEKETARVPPSLDSPQSAAPETFLSRDAVSAFPLLSGPCHNRCQVFGVPYGPRSNDRPGDSSGILLFGFPIEQVGDFFFRPAFHNLVCRQFVVGVSMRMSRAAASRNENPRAA